MEKKKPSFTVQNSKKKRVKSRWRKPRGIDSKQRIRKKQCGAVPKVGYKRKKGTGKKEILVRNMKELTEAKGTIRLAGAIGKRKRELMRIKASELKLRVVN